jgi:hypothetical protein
LGFFLLLYCNNTCKAEYEREEYIKKWKAGEESGIIGKDKIATAVKVYLREKYKNSCQCCGWHELNPYTGLVPLQIHHIDEIIKNLIFSYYVLIVML